LSRQYGPSREKERKNPQLSGARYISGCEREVEEIRVKTKNLLLSLGGGVTQRLPAQEPPCESPHLSRGARRWTSPSRNGLGKKEALHPIHQWQKNKQVATHTLPDAREPQDTRQVSTNETQPFFTVGVGFKKRRTTTVSKTPRGRWVPRGPQPAGPNGTPYATGGPMVPEI